MKAMMKTHRQIKEMAARASEEPWTTGGCVIYGANGAGVADLVAGICNHNGRTPDETEANAEFIAACRTNVPILVAALEEAQGKLDAVAALCRRAKYSIGVNELARIVEGEK